ncbi:MAG: alcohol dehydrogenase catalytic domain-containing protein, partial [Acidimicrobiales bacterium]
MVASESDGAIHGELTDLTDADLPEGDVTVAVSYSSLNYKDGLAVTGRGKIARRLPMVCGVDLVGRIEQSESPDFEVGQDVIVTGYGLSETHPGGFTQRQRVRSEWLVPLPEGLTPIQAMAIGTAGFTAMLCVMALEDAGVTPQGGSGAGRPAGSGGSAAGDDRPAGWGQGEPGEIVVTGAAGGVGSVAVAVLANLGYAVAASTGRPETHDYLRSLGATSMVDRAELSKGPARPLDAQRWAGGIDTVGSATLAAVLSQTT